MKIQFRNARESTRCWNLTKTGIQIVFFWCLFLYVLPLQILRLDASFGIPEMTLRGQVWVACLLFVVASLIGLWSGATMAVMGSGTPLPLDTARELVVSGPYSYVRNPMAIAGLAQGVAVAIYHGSFLVLGYALLGGVVWNYGVRPIEERDLLDRFGEPYARYQELLGCWIPRARQSPGKV